MGQYDIEMGQYYIEMGQYYIEMGSVCRGEGHSYQFLTPFVVQYAHFIILYQFTSW